MNASVQFGTVEAARIISPKLNGPLTSLVGTHIAVSSAALRAAQPLAAAAPMAHLQIVLSPSAARQAMAEKLVAAQHNPSNPLYRKWLTPDEYGQAFGVVDADIAAVSHWLTAGGLKVNGVNPARNLIDVSGTVGQVSSLFHTSEVKLSHANGDILVNTNDIAVPSALKGVVSGVMGLNSFHPLPLKTPTLVGRWDPGTHSVQASTVRSLRGAQPNAEGFYNGNVRGLFPADMRTIYGANPLIKHGITGKGITVAVVEDGGMVDADWTNFVETFGLGQYGGTYKQIQPQPAGGSANCTDPGRTKGYESGETVLDAEYVTGLAPGSHVVVAACGDDATNNFFGGVFIAATNLINASSGRPNVISASYGFGEIETDKASKLAIDAMWQQADAEGISVFVSTGDSGSNPSFNGGIINGVATTDANSLATSPHVTGVGGTDFSDIYDRKSGYFSANGTLASGSALSYVPEIPWNESCANPVIAEDKGYSSGRAFCLAQHKFDPDGKYLTSEGGSGGPSSTDAKPSWQAVYGMVQDGRRDLPDVALFAGSYDNTTYAVICDADTPCNHTFSNGVSLTGGTSLAAPMFAGIQALVDQGFVATGAGPDQGNAAPALYAMANVEYGSATKPFSGGLAACNAALGKDENGGCLFNNVQRGSIVTNCVALNKGATPGTGTPGCSIYGQAGVSQDYVGLTTSLITETNPTYTNADAAYLAKPGWSFASGLGSVNATTLLADWRLLSLQ